jgi:hypothetical protein
VQRGGGGGRSSSSSSSGVSHDDYGKEVRVVVAWRVMRLLAVCNAVEEANKRSGRVFNRIRSSSFSCAAVICPLEQSRMSQPPLSCRRLPPLCATRVCIVKHGECDWREARALLALCLPPAGNNAQQQQASTLRSRAA